MNCSMSRCFLRSRDSRYLDVVLSDQIPEIIGRSRLTKIKEKRCSRQQVKVTANFSQSYVEVLQLGANPSQSSQGLLRNGESRKLKDGATLFLVKGIIPYSVIFEPISSENGFMNSIQQNKDNLLPIPPKGNDMAKRKRESEESQNKKMKSNQSKTDSSDSSDDDDRQLEMVNAKLALMRKSMSCKSPRHKMAGESSRQQPIQTNSAAKQNYWTEEAGKLFIFFSEGVEGRSKIAAFDLDNTLICTKSGKVFPVDTSDWRIMYPEIPKKLQKLHGEEYKIVIFTNQKGISNGKVKISDFKKKIENIVQRLGIQAQVFVSTGSGLYRKPAPGMWDYLVQNSNGGIKLDLKSCFYVGDAAGRMAQWAPGKKKDFSCADRLFALNMQVAFHTPEEFFLGYKKADYTLPEFDPRVSYTGPLAVRYKSALGENCKSLHEKTIISHKPEVIVCVGFPASGKSHFVETYLLSKGYVHANRDILGSWQKCVMLCESGLSKGLSVVVDNTNPDAESRQRYVACAKKFKVPCRCFHFTCSLSQARHNNLFRQITLPDKAHLGVNDMIFNSYKSKYQEPDLKEGFSELIRIYFVPKFVKERDERLYRMFLIEK